MLSDCSRVPACPHVSARLVLERIYVLYNVIVGTFLKICREIPNRALGKKYLHFYMKTWAHVIALGSIKLL